MAEHIDWDSMLAKVKLEDDTVGEIKPILKPCPFCGEVPEIETHEDLYRRVKFGIECRSAVCEIQPLTAWYADKQECVEAWNRRSDGK